MVTTVKTANKNINLSKLMEELTGAGFTSFGITMAGFNQLNDRIYQPNATTKVISTSTGQPDVTAEPGEFHLKTDAALSGAEDTALDGVLTTHDDTVLTAEQTRQDVDNTDSQLLLNEYENWDSLDATQKAVAQKRLTRLTVRLILGKDAEI